MKFTTAAVLTLTTTLFATIALAYKNCDDCTASYEKHNCATKIGGQCGVIRKCLEHQCKYGERNPNLVWVGDTDGTIKDLSKLSGMELAEAELAQASETAARANAWIANADREKAQREKDAYESAKKTIDEFEHGPMWQARIAEEQRQQAQREEDKKKDEERGRARRKKEAQDKAAAEKEARERDEQWRVHEEQLAREKALRQKEMALAMVLRQEAVAREEAELKQAHKQHRQQAKASAWQDEALERAQSNQEQYSDEIAQEGQAAQDVEDEWDQNANST